MPTDIAQLHGCSYHTATLIARQIEDDERKAGKSWVRLRAIKGARCRIPVEAYCRAYGFKPEEVLPRLSAKPPGRKQLQP